MDKKFDKISSDDLLVRREELKNLIADMERILSNLEGELTSNFVDDFTIRMRDEYEFTAMQRENYIKEYEEIKKMLS